MTKERLEQQPVCHPERNEVESKDLKNKIPPLRSE